MFSAQGSATEEYRRSLGITESGVVASCRYEGDRSGLVGVEAKALAVGVVRPDGRLAVRRVPVDGEVAVFPTALKSVSHGLNLAVGRELIRFSLSSPEEYEHLSRVLKEALGGRFLPGRLDSPAETVGPGTDAAPEDAGQAPSADAEPESTDAVGAFGEDTQPEVPWYAEVSGPAVRAFFHEDVLASGVETAPSAEEDPEFFWKAQLEENPLSVEPYRNLFRHYYENRDLERAYWFASVLDHFGVAEPLEAEVVRRYSVTRPIPPSRPIDEAMWQEMLLHPLVENWSENFFGIVGRAFAQTQARSLKSYGLRAKDRVDVETSSLLVANVFRYVTEALKLHDTALYVAPEAAFELAVANVMERGRWSLCCVAGSALTAGRSEKEVAFVMARDLSYLKSAHLVALLAPDVVQQTKVMFAAMSIVRPNVVPEGDREEAERFGRNLARYLSDKEIERLEILLDKMLQGQGATLNLADWNRGVQLTSHRVGLLVCQDLPTALRLALTDPTRATNLDMELRVQELVRYAVDERHSRARRILGLAISA